MHSHILFGDKVYCSKEDCEDYNPFMVEATQNKDVKQIIDSLIQEIKQDNSVSVNQSTYAIKKLEELKERL